MIRRSHCRVLHNDVTPFFIYFIKITLISEWQKTSVTDKYRLHGKFDQAKPDNRTLLQEDSQDTAFKKSIWILLPECLRVVLLHPLH